MEHAFDLPKAVLIAVFVFVAALRILAHVLKVARSLGYRLVNACLSLVVFFCHDFVCCLRVDKGYPVRQRGSRIYRTS
ncbi:MAG: hypothetical protein U9R48_00335 [Chloroflexota bacterium]|nr:hypothetical protein [Chloroflexota bacterium]